MNVLTFRDEKKEEEIAAIEDAISRPPDFQAYVYLLLIEDHTAGGRVDPSEIDPRLARTVERVATMRWLIERFCDEKEFDPDELISEAINGLRKNQAERDGQPSNDR